MFCRYLVRASGSHKSPPKGRRSVFCLAAQELHLAGLSTGLSPLLPMAHMAFAHPKSRWAITPRVVYSLVKSSLRAKSHQAKGRAPFYQELGDAQAHRGIMRFGGRRCLLWKLASLTLGRSPFPESTKNRNGTKKEAKPIEDLRMSKRTPKKSEVKAQSEGIISLPAPIGPC